MSLDTEYYPVRSRRYTEYARASSIQIHPGLATPVAMMTLGENPPTRTFDLAVLLGAAPQEIPTPQEPELAQATSASAYAEPTAIDAAERQ